MPPMGLHTSWVGKNKRGKIGEKKENRREREQRGLRVRKKKKNTEK